MEEHFAKGVVGDGIFGFFQRTVDAITNTVVNYDVVLFLLLLVVLVFGSIILFVCSISKIFQFQAARQTEARDKIREKKRKMLYTRHLIETEKSFEHEQIKIKTETPNEVKSDDIYDLPQRLQAPAPENWNDDQTEVIELDYSQIYDDPKQLDNMWNEPA